MDKSDELEQYLQGVFNWVRAQAPQVIDHLKGPADKLAMAEVSAQTGLTLPADYQQFLQRHDGEDQQTWLALLGEGHQLLACEAIVAQYQQEQEIAKMWVGQDFDTLEFWKDRVQSGCILVRGPVKPLMTHPRWLPLTCMNGDVFRYFDFDPAPGGIQGQIIEVDPEGCSYQVLAPDFTTLLRDYLTELEANHYVADQEGFIERVNPPEEHWEVPAWLS